MLYKALSVRLLLKQKKEFGIILNINAVPSEDTKKKNSPFTILFM